MILTPADDRSYDKVLKLIKKTPETLDLELDVSELKSTPRQKEDRKRTRRDTRPRPIADHGQTASMKPIEAPAPTPRKAAEPAPVETAEQPPLVAAEGDAPKTDKPRRSRGGRGRKTETTETTEATPTVAAVAARPARDDVRPRGRGRGRDGSDSEPSRTPGFGDSTPAFLLRPALKKEPA